MIWPFNKKATAYRTNARPDGAGTDEAGASDVKNDVELLRDVAGGQLFKRVHPQHKCTPPRIESQKIRIDISIAIDVQNNDIWQCACGQRFRVIGNSYVTCGAVLGEDADKRWGK